MEKDPFLCKLSPEQLVQLSLIMKVVNYKENDVILAAKTPLGSKFFIALKGTIYSGILKIASKGDCVGTEELLN